MSNHTPGTWTVCSDPSLYGGYIIEQAAQEQNEWVAEGYEISDAEGDRRGEVAAERDQANATFIGKAPEMYEFIREVAYGGDTPFEHIAQRLLKEIDNATPR